MSLETTCISNLTNRCPCRCTFCIRQKSRGVGTGNDLWLEYEPNFNEVVRALEEKELSAYEAIIFCGYGEPLEHIDPVVAVCKYLKEKDPDYQIRINTNGLGGLRGIKLLEFSQVRCKNAP